MGTAAYSELLQCLRALPPDERPSIVHIQETHCHTDTEYRTPGWYAVATVDDINPALPIIRNIA